jgi:hypothetical protein
MKGNESIAVISIVGAVILCLAYVIIVALKNPNKKVEAQLIWKGFIKFVLKITGHDPKPQPPPAPDAERSQAIRDGSPAVPSRVRPWFFRHWRAVVLASLALLLIVLPATWWLNQSPLADAAFL